MGMHHNDDDWTDVESWRELLTSVPEQGSQTQWLGRAVLFAVFLVWGLVMIRLDVRTGEMGNAFLHRPLLIFHEAGHVIFRPFGEWMTIFGGTLGQLLMPTILGLALLLKNRDPFGASIGLWFLGVSLLDVAPYVYDAVQPQLMLLSGTTGEEGGHDWIYLLRSMGLLQKSKLVGTLVHALGVMVLVLSWVWGGYLLLRQRAALAESQA